MNNHLVELVLTCGSWQEAQRIADALLEKRLVTSVESFEIKAEDWESHLHGVQEVKVLVIGPADNFTKIKTLANQVSRTRTAPVLLTELTK